MMPVNPQNQAAADIEISLLGTFSLRVERHPVSQVSLGSQRLLVYLALHAGTRARMVVARTMWPEVPDHRAGFSLRSALSRLDASTRRAIVVSSTGLGLIDTVAVDVRHSRALAQRLLQPGGSPCGADLGPAAAERVRPLSDAAGSGTRGGADTAPLRSGECAAATVNAGSARHGPVTAHPSR